jgi:pimeloyl-ACP methyl ester carboxylesterase
MSSLWLCANATRLLRAALIVVGFGLLFLVLIRQYGVRYLLFPTWVLVRHPPRPALDRGEVWTLETDEGAVEAFFFPAEASLAPAILFAHGNGEIIDDNLRISEWYRDHGFSILLPEYRGYGRSRGTPAKDSIVRDFVAFYDRLRSHPRVDATRIYFHGRSLGGAVAAAAAVERPPRGLVLESTFTSVRQLARDRRLPGFLVADSFDSEAALKGTSVPVLLIHGRQDDIVPARHALQLASIIPHHTLVMMNCAHNDCPLAETQILHFLNSTTK